VELVEDRPQLQADEPEEERVEEVVSSGVYQPM
jgi:hypothetical protein